MKIIIDNTKPSPNALEGTGFTNAGKNNKLIVKKLIKVVLNDIECEIAYTIDYVDYLKKEIERLKKIEELIEKRNSAKKKSDIEDYDQYINFYLKPNESRETIQNLYHEFSDAYTLKKETLEKLSDEIKIIKKLKV